MQIKDISRHVFKMFFICMKQLTLVGIILNNFLRKEEESSNEQKVSTGLLIVQFICIFLLHLQIESEVRQAVYMMKYLLNHPENFRNHHDQSTKFTAVLIAIIQMVTSVMTEILNLILILNSKNSQDALMNFVALSVICEIDNIYFKTIQG